MHREAETCLQDFCPDIPMDIYTKRIIEIYAGAIEGRSGFASALY